MFLVNSREVWAPGASQMICHTLFVECNINMGNEVYCCFFFSTSWHLLTAGWMKSGLIWSINRLLSIFTGDFSVVNLESVQYIGLLLIKSSENTEAIWSHSEHNQWKHYLFPRFSIPSAIFPFKNHYLHYKNNSGESPKAKYKCHWSPQSFEYQCSKFITIEAQISAVKEFLF